MGAGWPSEARARGPLPASVFEIHSDVVRALRHAAHGGGVGAGERSVPGNGAADPQETAAQAADTVWLAGVRPPL